MLPHPDTPAEPVIPPGNTFRWVGVLLVGCVCLAVVGFCLPAFFAPPPVPRVREQVAVVSALPEPAPVAQDYVGSASCAECHAALVQKYQSHPMAHSAVQLPEPQPLENLSQAHFETTAAERYLVEQQGEDLLHHEIGFTPTGEVIYDQAYPVRYALGSGQRGRSYLIERAGAFTLSPISWYGQQQTWDLSPGYVPGRHERFERVASERCLSCHVGRLTPAPPSPSSTPVTPVIHELAISCERCHGPAQRHVAFRRGQLTLPRDPIVNPVHLQPAQRDAVCNQCHLQGVEEVLRAGRTDLDFRPGMSLGDVWTQFLQSAGSSNSAADTTKAVSQVQQMHSSRCFVASAGKLGCVSCHVPTTDQKAEFFRGRCQTCHTTPDQDCRMPLAQRQAAPYDNSCIACHMPRLAASDVPHTTQTDHRLLRNPQAAPQSRETPQPARWELFEPTATALLPVEDQRARGILLARLVSESRDLNGAAQARDVLAPCLAAFPGDVELRDALASVEEVLGRVDAAANHWQAAVTIQPRFARGQRALARYWRARNRPELAFQHLEQAIHHEPWGAEQHQLHAEWLHQRGLAAPALESLRQSRLLNPANEELYNLGTRIADSLEDRPAAREFRRQAQLLRQR